MHLRRLDEHFHEFMLAIGGTHAITFNPNIRTGAGAENLRLFRQGLREVHYVVAQHVCGFPRRQRERVAPHLLPAMNLVLETRSRFGSEERGLHGHGVVCLNPEKWGGDVADRYRAALRLSSGRDADPHEAAHIDRGLLRESISSDECPHRKWAIAPMSSQPSFCLRPLESVDWTIYANKHVTDDSIQWTVKDFFA